MKFIVKEIIFLNQSYLSMFLHFPVFPFSFFHIIFIDDVLESIRAAGFIAPTPIQSQGWPMALSGRDLIGIAATGSGKTLSFILPALIHIRAQPYLQPGEGPICLVLSPTRELANQIQEAAIKNAMNLANRAIKRLSNIALAKVNKVILQLMAVVGG